MYSTILLTLILAALTFYFQSVKFIEDQERIARNLSSPFSLAIMQSNRLLLETTSGLAINSQGFDQVCILRGNEIIYSLPSASGGQCNGNPQSWKTRSYLVPLASTPQYKLLFRFSRFHLPVGSTGFILISVFLIILIVVLMLGIKGMIDRDILNPFKNNIEVIKGLGSSSVNFHFSGISEINELFHSFAAKIKQVKELSEKDLIRTKNNERDKAIAETTQMIAHDLKGPLTVFQKVAFGSSSEFQNEQPNLKSALNRMISMADSIKVADIAGIVKPSKVNLDISEVIASIRPLADKKGIKLLDASSDLKDIYIDLPKVERAVSNLLINGIEAAQSWVKVAVTLHGTSLIIQVTDDGQGVPSRIEPKLFQRGVTYGKEKGSGLGLSFVRHVAMGHGGDVNYQRQDGVSIFSMTLENVVVGDNRKSATVKNPTRSSSVSKVLINIEDKVLENQILENLRIKFPREDLTTDATEAASCKLIFGDDPSLLHEKYPSDVKLMISTRNENCSKIVRRIERELTL